jgi:hypothetical protein
MYASVVHFDSYDDATGQIVSDGRPLKSVRKFTNGSRSIVLRVFEAEGKRLKLKVTRDVLGGEILFEGTVKARRHIRVVDESESFWVIAVSKNEIRIDPDDKGAWPENAEHMVLPEVRPEYERKPKTPLGDLIPAPERETPPYREASSITGSDIRFLVAEEGGFFDGTSIIEVWYDACDVCFRVRFWHECGATLSGRMAMQINPPERVELEEMDNLISVLKKFGLADTYSEYRNLGIVDGGGWGLTIGTKDGYRWEWDGSNAYPQGWKEARNAICALFLGYPSRTAFDGHAAYVSSWHGADGDLGRTDIAHLYRHGVGLNDLSGRRISNLCANIRQDILLYRRTRRYEFECRILDGKTYAEIMSDVIAGRSYRRTTGELMGAIGYIVDHDDAEQTNMNKLAVDGTLGKLLCNPRVRAKAAPGLAVSGWDV